MQFDTLTIVGVGLLGGSLGLAAKERGLVRHVHGIGRNAKNLDQACSLGILDSFSLEWKAPASSSQLVVFCTPVDQIVEQALTLAPTCPPETIFTDVGSTKVRIVRGLEGKIRFVGSHPLAGSEKRGAEFAKADLFDQRSTLLTPTELTDPAALERVRAFWIGVGSQVRELSPETHDQALALTSHLPHLVASALASLIPPELFDLTATGFRSTTRIAAGDPALWSAIFLENREAVLDSIEMMQQRLQQFRLALDSSDRSALDHLLEQGKKVRDALGN